MKRAGPRVAKYPEERAERIAAICGQSSAAACALVELKSRRAAGEDVSLYVCGAWVFVGPTEHTANKETSE